MPPVIKGEYPPDWKAISDATWAAAGHRCVRCRHPYRKGEHGKGEKTPCDDQCVHAGPIEVLHGEKWLPVDLPVGDLIKAGRQVVALWRIGTVHHFDGNKANCVWWNLLALCQRCHLTIQARVNPEQPYMFEHSEWLKPFVAGFYGWKYEGKQLTRDEVAARQFELLAYERIV